MVKDFIKLKEVSVFHGFCPWDLSIFPGKHLGYVQTPHGFLHTPRLHTIQAHPETSYLVKWMVKRRRPPNFGFFSSFSYDMKMNDPSLSMEWYPSRSLYLLFPYVHWEGDIISRLLSRTSLYNSPLRYFYEKER